MIVSEKIKALLETVAYLKDVAEAKPVFLTNDAKPNFKDAMLRTKFTANDIAEAEKRLSRFAPYIMAAFPETIEANGLIESKLSSIEELKVDLESYYQTEIVGKLWLKRDDLLPIAGTIKARGAIYEVLKHAESLALDKGMLNSYEEDYVIFASQAFKDFFSNYRIVVGTTGNLGISVGVMGAKLGFEVTVHMSVEAKEWKKNLLRSRGVTVIEHETNFTQAVQMGRSQSLQDEQSYFVDDEFSQELFLGYTVAGGRLKEQLDQLDILVDEDHPLFVYLPCGIGGSPGGITFGLKQVYGDHVHCFFAEPTQMPSMLIGLMTKEYDQVSIEDFNIDGSLTNMDGLAVPRTSGFVAKLMHNFFDGGYTVSEKDNFTFLKTLVDKKAIALEPAAVVGVTGPARLFNSAQGQAYIKAKGLDEKMKQANHISWATGGSMVPEADRQAFYQAIDQYV